MEPTKRRSFRTMLAGAGLALLCVVFTWIYEQFSHGATSDHMRAMFLMPLCGCAIPSLFGFITPLHRYVSRIAFNLWNSGLATWTVGCLFVGIVNISGRFTDLDRLYWGLGWLLLGLSVMVEVIHLIVTVFRIPKNRIRRDP